MLDLPDELLIFLCWFLNVDVVGKLRSTCTYIRDTLSCNDALTNALFVQNGTWYELKNVGLTAKCVQSQSLRMPNTLPCISTMQNVALFGTVTVKGQLLATFGPVPCNFFIDLDELTNLKASQESTGSEFTVYAMEWSHMIDLDWINGKLESRFTYKHHLRPGASYWATAVCLTMYAIVKDAGRAQIYHFIDKIVNSNVNLAQIGPDAEFIDYITVHTDAIEVTFNEEDRAVTVPFQKWLEEYADADEAEQYSMQAVFAKEQAFNGLGWMNSRAYILESVLAQLRRSSEKNES